MQQFEYRVIPAPAKGEKDRGLKTGAERFAHALTRAMNDMARDGWEYLRADTLPAEERSGLTSKTTVYHNLLVFRRAVAAGADPGRVQPPPPERAEAPPAQAHPEEPKARRLLAETPEGAAPRLGPAAASMA
ncbi:DUF4177 domain-containing protein [Pontitalea aquivivens]|uniref:DUF4177 domain-containing protein n=1 Tax=Pontitalea aquivivens TaxID=3388663 RepID=UPI0039707664